MINLNSTKVSDRGSNGIYWRYDVDSGIKITLRDDYATRQEGNWLKKLNKLVPGIFPKFKGFVYVSFDGEKTLAYKMEHIKGVLFMADSAPKWIQKKLDAVVKQLVKQEIWFGDVIGNSIITPRKKVRLIDADPVFFRYKGKRP